MYCVNNVVVVSHKGLFIHLDLSFPVSYHDVTMLHHSNLYSCWRVHFTYGDGYFEYLLENPKCLGENMLIMQ